MTRTVEAGQLIHLDMGFALQAQAEDGFIKGIASTPTVDLCGHKVMPGAFDKSIKQRGLNGPKGVQLLAYHNPEKHLGTIKRLETVGKELQIEAQLNLNVSYAKDVYEITKQNGGLSFSVGFTLEDFDFADEKEAPDGEWLIIKSGDLREVSVVCFPAQPEAQMTFIKSLPPNTVSEFEKALIAEGFCFSRNDAHRLTRVVKESMALFAPPPPPRPLLDVHKLKAASDLAAQAKAILSSR